MNIYVQRQVNAGIAFGVPYRTYVSTYLITPLVTSFGTVEYRVVREEFRVPVGVATGGQRVGSVNQFGDLPPIDRREHYPTFPFGRNQASTLF
ncbi:MAG: hypothetical protein WCF25_01130 [Acidimicrobiales bacterium]